MPRAWPSSPTENEVMLYRYRKEGGGGVIAREIVASCIQATLRFVLRLKAKGCKRGGGAYLRDTTVLDKLEDTCTSNTPSYKLGDSNARTIAVILGQEAHSILFLGSPH